MTDLKLFRLDTAGRDVELRGSTVTLEVELQRVNSSVKISRPQTGTTATLSRTGAPDSLVSLARRETRDCLAEDLRRLDPDEIYHAALAGLAKVIYE